MVDIYVDLFLVNTWIEEHGEMRDRADTTLVYDEVFLRNGVTYEEFNEAVFYYMGQIEDYNDIAEMTAKKLEQLADHYLKLHNTDRENHEENRRNRVSYVRGKFPSDSLSKAEKMSYWPTLRNSSDTLKQYYMLKKQNFINSDKKINNSIK